jgi:murein DD-endopeptidase MepM/ murein hydrolase activator NlpD
MQRLIRAAPFLVLALALMGGLPLPPAARAAPAPQGSWTWPLEPPPAVVRTFDPPERPWLSGHRGVDLSASPGAHVLSPAGGTVVFAGRVVDRPVVTVEHGDGLRSSYEPVNGLVPVGTAVGKGAPIGTVDPGSAGHCAPETCLHWGVRDGDEYVDPLQFVQDRRPSVLLPWSGGG